MTKTAKSKKKVSSKGKSAVKPKKVVAVRKVKVAKTKVAKAKSEKIKPVKTKPVKANVVKVKPVKAKAVKPAKPAKKPDVRQTANKAKPDVPAKTAKAARKTVRKVASRKPKGLKAEILAAVNEAFKLCLASIEQASNLMESRLASVLGEISNLVSGAKPTFASGKLKSVVSPDGTERTDYTYEENGTVTSRTYRNGKLKFEIVHNKFGVPLSGKMLDENGNCVREFEYGPDGQVK